MIPFAFGWVLLAYASLRVRVTRSTLMKGRVEENPKLNMHPTRYSIRSIEG